MSKLGKHLRGHAVAYVALFFALCMWLASSLVAPLELPFVLRVGAAVGANVTELAVATDCNLILRDASDLDQLTIIHDTFQLSATGVAEGVSHCRA